MDDPLLQPPPWQVFPGMQPADAGARQGAQEAWVDQVWRPFWSALTPSQRQAYLAHWGASEEWQQAIRATFEPDPGFDAAADLADSQRHLAEVLSASPTPGTGGWGQRIARWLGRR